MINRRVAALAVSIAFVAAACSTGTASSVPTTSSTPTTAGSAAAPTTQPVSGSTGESPTTAVTQSSPSTSPTPTSGQAPTTTFVPDETKGDAEFGLTEKEIARRVDAVESLTAACMSAQGFEYYPVDYTTARAAMDANSKPSGMSGADFRAQYGYGVTTLYGGAADQKTLGAGDNNLQYVASLTPADRVAYERALYGEHTDASFVVAMDNEDFSTTGGCTKQAVSQVFTADELGASFVNYQNGQGDRVDADPRVVAAYQDWSGCMRDKGYNYAKPDEIKADLLSQLDAITGGQPLDSLSADQKQQLSDLQALEVEVAAVDDQCDLKYVADVVAAVQAELGIPQN